MTAATTAPETSDQAERDRRVRATRDLRLLAPAAAAWCGSLWAFAGPLWLAIGSCLLLLVLVLSRRWWVGLGMLIGLVAAATVASLHQQAVRDNPVAETAREGGYVHVGLRLTSDARVRPGTFGEYVVVRASTEWVERNGSDLRSSVRVPILVVGNGAAVEALAGIPLGTRLEARGRLQEPTSRDLAGLLTVSLSPAVVEDPTALFNGAEVVRAAIRQAAAGGSEAGGALVPALVVGDDAALPGEVVDDFVTAGLTHLTAVSGTNLTLVVGFLLIVGRGLGVRGRGQIVLGVLGVAGFVLLARTEPSVVRAATMGVVGLLGMGAGGRERGVRALSLAVLVLLLMTPALARSPGFVLSVLATAGILFLGPVFRDALLKWAPRWCAEAVAVPLAAQLACTPVVAVLSGEVSLVAVVANIVAAPAVGPATVLGLGAGLIHLLLPPVGGLVGLVATWCADWIVASARHAADLPVASVGWPTSAAGVMGLTVLCLVGAAAAPLLLRRRRTALASLVVVTLVIVRPVGLPDFAGRWPGAGWIVVACDVGQGDALVLRAGPEEAVVVDAGPDPKLVDGCLDRLGIERVPLTVLTHFHADHVAGLAGVIEGRRVGGLWVTGVSEPAENADDVRRLAEAEGLRVEVPAIGARVTVGELHVEVLGPSSTAGVGANDASLVLLATVRDQRILLTGDVEPPAQQALARRLGDLSVDVLKVPHHGSRFQDPRWLLALGARVAVISAGADNDYGHPAPETLALFQNSGATVLRTDQQGDVAVLLTDAGLATEVSD